MPIEELICTKEDCLLFSAMQHKVKTGKEMKTIIENSIAADNFTNVIVKNRIIQLHENIRDANNREIVDDHKYILIWSHDKKQIVLMHVSR